MQTLINKILPAKDKEALHIFSLLPAALSNVPFHNDTKSITRYFAERFPLHLAIHEVSPVLVPPREYTQPHIHEDFDEVNIIVSLHTLIYKIELGDDEYTVSNNSCLWIPRGMVHSANVLKGSGHFITLRLD
jgi:mannose-6-phosphate isomerase-like protein (cupin superfamily)